MNNPVIRRYFDRPGTLARIGTDFKFLIRMVSNSGNEYSIQLREEYFNVYYKGNSLAKVTPRRGSMYWVEIHQKFLCGKVFEWLSKYSDNKPHRQDNGTKAYIRFVVEKEHLHRFLQKKHVQRLSRSIERLNYGEEISFEQVLITDNPATSNFIIIDRQIADHKMKAQMDLLALSRPSGEGSFHFVVIEVKLGNNPELRSRVGEQLNGYVKHVQEYIQDYISCYQRNYEQKRQMGLLADDLPAAIKISARVEGLVVVGGYSQIADKALSELAIHWSKIKVKQMKNTIAPY